MRSDTELDNFIEDALRGDATLAPAPRTLRPGVARRIHYAQLRDREARRFRTVLLIFVGCTLASFLAVAAAAIFAMGQPALRPGFGGLEYQIARWASVWSEVRGDVAFYGGIAVVAAVLIAALPLGKRLLNN